MRESEFHEWLIKAVPPADGALIGIGDDAAVLDTCGRIAVAADMLIEGVHYRAEEPSAQMIGAKAVNRNFSDMAAMGLWPHWLLISTAVPAGCREAFVTDLVTGMVRAAEACGAGIVGGDTSRSLGDLAINVTVIGKIEDLEPVTRSGAEPGDRIMVTHDLGGSALGKHLSFTPRVREGCFLNRTRSISAMIDISDGLAIDLSRILDASGRGAILEGDKIPLSEAAFKQAESSGRRPLDHALTDGEDFELLFTLAPDEAERLLNDARLSFHVTQIGEIQADPEQRVLRLADSEHRLEREGYDHAL